MSEQETNGAAGVPEPGKLGVVKFDAWWTKFVHFVDEARDREGLPRPDRGGAGFAKMRDGFRLAWNAGWNSAVEEASRTATEEAGQAGMEFGLEVPGCACFYRQRKKNYDTTIC